LGSPFSFWSAGTDNGVPEKNRRWPRRSLLLTIAGFVVVIVLVAVLVPHV
jgi:hypothetical protein